MRHWWKKSLAGQFIGFLLLALVAAQGLTYLITCYDQRQTLREVYNTEFLGRTATVANLLETIPAEFRDDVVVAGGTNYTRFWITASGPADAVAWKDQALEQIKRPLRALPQVTGEEEDLSGTTLDVGPVESAETAATLTSLALDPSVFPASAQVYRFTDENGLGVALPLNDGSWLNAGYYKLFPADFLNGQTLLSIGITAGILSLLGAVTARRITRPLRHLAASAEALGRGEAAPVPEGGPDDVRRTCEAFNRMQLRLLRYVEDRTRMLAAVSHDIRTPLTTLRLRAEFVADADLKSKMLASIAEMQRMTEATLSFAKDEAAVEPTRTVELNSLVESLCDDLIELGQDVEFEEGTKASLRCRPDGLRRAVRNLVENAVRYGGQAHVSLRSSHHTVEIMVADRGPGIPENLQESVFSPFFRLEQSRNRQTGGVGLGLSIARAIVRHHGGDVILRHNNPGLLASIVLPKT